LEPAKQNDLHQEVADRLRQAILERRFQPGERLRETELATMLEVSRGPVREALAQLEHEGLIITQRNRGATVARLSEQDEGEVKSLRLALERLAVQLAVRCASPSDLAALEAEIERLKSACRGRTTVHDIADFEVRFHDLLYRMSGHKRLYRAWSALRAQAHILHLSRNVDKPGIRHVIVARHTALLDAIRSRDEAAALAIVEAHVFGFKEPPSEVVLAGTKQRRRTP
jgi:DNA-binding GntR family transcriptional regulator